MLGAAIAVLVLWASVGRVSTADAEAVADTFHYTGGEQTFTVPAGVSSVSVIAVGGRGAQARNGGGAGGAAAQVSGELSVTPGEVLYVEVGGDGQTGGFNGGGGGVGDGGGASDVRASPRSAGLSPDSRLLVAGGGGGGGDYSPRECGIGGAGGDAGAAGGINGCGDGGGQPGTQTSGGEAGQGCWEGEEAGRLGTGGAAKNVNWCEGVGGGGGGGYYGGGAGDDGGGSGGGGGGGGGSSLVPAGGIVALASAGTEPQVVIDVPPYVAPTVISEAASDVGQTAATLNATVNPEGGLIGECQFEYGTSVSYGSTVPCTTGQDFGSSAVAASASPTGLSANTTYYFRVVASNAGGTSDGSGSTFSTPSASAPQTFFFTGGEQQFTVPAGVYAIKVLAVGGHGGSSASAAGGEAAEVTGELEVSPGETLYVEVAGNGQEEQEGGAGGFNGGGAGRPLAYGSGGGGGASDVRTSPRLDGLLSDTRLIVAGGGGGGGGGNFGCSGGSAGHAGQGSEHGCNGGGGPGTETQGGEGTGPGCSGLGEAGSLGAGGAGASGLNDGCRWATGGGGGAGLYGGAGGSGGGGGQTGGGGGGGSSLLPPGGSLTLAPESAEPEVQIYGLAGTPGIDITTTTLTLAEGHADSSYSQTLAASKGTPPYTWSITAGALPEGLHLNAESGSIVGTPSAAGTSHFTVEATDSSTPTPRTGTASLSITVSAATAQAAEYGQCVAGKKGEYTEGNCQTKSAKARKGTFEWVAGPAPGCVAQKKGEYTNATCATKSAKAKKGKYEKAPGPGFTSTTGPATLETPGLGGSKVLCAAGTAVGEVTGVKTGTERITFTGCEAAGEACASEGPSSTPSGKAGVIVTNLLDSRLIGPVSGEVWTQLASSEHEPYVVEFGCGGQLLRTIGSLAGVQSADVNVSSLTSTTTFAAGNGEQALYSELSGDGGASWAGPDATSGVTVSSNTAASKTEIKT